MEETYKELLKKIDQQPQFQGSTSDQLYILRVFANKLGFYDAADFINSLDTSFKIYKG